MQLHVFDAAGFRRDIAVEVARLPKCGQARVRWTDADGAAQVWESEAADYEQASRLAEQAVACILRGTKPPPRIYVF